MAYIRDENRTLATLETIILIRPGDHETETATTGRGPVIVRHGQYQPGDQVIYFRAGTALPLTDQRYWFLAARGITQIHGRQFHVLRAAMLLPAGPFEPDIATWQTELDDPTMGQLQPGDGVALALDLYRLETRTVAATSRPARAKPRNRSISALFR